MDDPFDMFLWWESLVAFIIGIALPVFLILLGLTVGRLVERRHLNRIQSRRQALAHVLVSDIKTFPMMGKSRANRPPPQLLVGEAVIAADYLKSLLAKLRKIFGGELRSYQNLMYRAREEAIVRLLEQAQAQGYDAVCNLRLTTADVGGSSTASKRKAAFAAVIATGTAYCRGNSPA